MAKELIAKIQTDKFGLGENPTERTLISIYPGERESNACSLPCVKFFLDELNIGIRAGMEMGAPILKNDIDFFKDALDFISKLKL